MKKKYVKPLIQIESFQLDAAVAAACGVPIGHAEYECVHESGYFASDDCDADPQSLIPDYDQFCYHGPLANIEFLQS